MFSTRRPERILPSTGIAPLLVRTYRARDTHARPR
eukprot:COSAG02_NODE_10817_length_1852_cov_1.786651_1_plen_34_part_10